jgi:hypothetical protein
MCSSSVLSRHTSERGRSYTCWLEHLVPATAECLLLNTRGTCLHDKGREAGRPAFRLGRGVSSWAHGTCHMTPGHPLSGSCLTSLNDRLGGAKQPLAAARGCESRPSGDRLWAALRCRRSSASNDPNPSSRSVTPGASPIRGVRMETEDCDIIVPWDRHFASQEEAVAAFRSSGWHEPSSGVLYNERFWTLGAALRWIAERSQEAVD